MTWIEDVLNLQIHPGMEETSPVTLAECLASQVPSTMDEELAKSWDGWSGKRPTGKRAGRPI